MSKCKYGIGDKIFLYNVNMQNPLVTEMVIAGIITNDDGFYYTNIEKSGWVKEDFVFKARMEAYRALIQQAENEMKQPDIVK